jgi:threonine dehydrogenase-like Zn-dependent dehydrogenase
MISRNRKKRIILEMKAKALRLHSANDLRVDEFELPKIKEDEILVEVISNSICMSTHKCAILGTNHKRVHNDVAEHPAIMGHEFAGVIVEVGDKYKNKYQRGMKFTIQPALNYKGTMWSPGYSYEFCGGNATYCIIPHEVMDQDCFLEYKGNAYYEASLAEPMSCCIGAFHANYHTKMGVYSHEMGIKKGGCLALLAAGGPMGLGSLTYAINCDSAPSKIVVTDINEERINRAKLLFPKEEIAKKGIDLEIINTKNMKDPAKELKALNNGNGFDDIFCFAPIPSIVELASDILGRDGCLNFFSGPTDQQLSAKINLYDVHYNSTHLMGTTGGNTDDMKESLLMSEHKLLDPSVMVTHIGGLDSAADTILNLPTIPGGKKLIYTHLQMPLTAIEDFEKLGQKDHRFKELANITKDNRGLWCAEAEKYLLANWT